MEIPDAQLEYEIDGRPGRVNVEVATGNYSGKTIAGKAAAGFAVHGSTHRAAAKVASSIGGKMARSFGKGEDKGRSGGRRRKPRRAEHRNLRRYAPLEDQRG